MKQKLILIVSLLLLLTLITFMIIDFFVLKPANTNPHELDLNALRINDTLKSPYAETRQYNLLLSKVYGIGTDSDGNIYISGKDSIEILDSGGRVKNIFRINGNANCISVDQDKKMFIGLEDHIVVLRPDGTQEAEWTSPGPDAVLIEIVTDGQGVFVTDFGYKIVYHYDRSGNLLNKIGQKDPEMGVPGFIIPSAYFDIAMDPDGYLWVANSGRHELEKFDRNGKLLGKWGSAGLDIAGFSGCCNPTNIALLPGGGFVTSEKGIERIKIYDADGNFVCVVAFPSSFDPGTSGLDLAIGNNGEILVLDPKRKLVRIFEMAKQPD
jgi:hypothetical protein